MRGRLPFVSRTQAVGWGGQPEPAPRFALRRSAGSDRKSGPPGQQRPVGSQRDPTLAETERFAPLDEETSRHIMLIQGYPDPGDGLRLHLNENTGGGPPRVFVALPPLTPTDILTQPSCNGPLPRFATDLFVDSTAVLLTNLR